jgi:hypothetical protein
VFRDASQHSWTDLDAIVKGEDEVGPAGAAERTVGTCLAFVCQPIRWSAASTRLARVAGHCVMRRG